MKPNYTVKDAVSLFLLGLGFAGSVSFFIKFIQGNSTYDWNLLFYAIMFTLFIFGLDLRYKK